VDIGLPPNTIYACLAETLLLTLDKRFGHYTLGREIDPQKVRQIDAIGEKHGFQLAPIRSFGTVVSDEHIERLRQLNTGHTGRFAEVAHAAKAAGSGPVQRLTQQPSA
jgi:hypothetical protein